MFVKQSIFYISSLILLSCNYTKLIQDIKPDLEINETIKPGIILENEFKPCPNDMIEINGDYCPNPKLECLYWVDSHGIPSKINAKCGEWKKPVICLSEKVHKHYCIDKYEFPNKKGEVPQDWMSWYDAEKFCKSIGKRLCTKSEWTFAAEGPTLHPYPFGDGYHRISGLCNIDNSIPKINIFNARNSKTPEAIILHNLLVPSGSQKNCVSDWGVYDMAGNVDEWVVNETGIPFKSGLVGGHIFGVRNASVPMTTAHGPDFSWYESGFRCAKNIGINE